jgi:cell wall-associated NlpC family hydrolase
VLRRSLLVLVAGASFASVGVVRAGAQATEATASRERKKPFAAFSASASALRDSVVSKARAQIGTRYRLGGTTANLALDCSGLVKVVMGALDVILPRTAQQQSKMGQEIPKDLAALKPGDLLTFGRGKNVSHIGIYVGEGRMVHASTSKRRVIETALTTRNPLVRQWKGVRRVVFGDTAELRDSLLAIADTLR